MTVFLPKARVAGDGSVVRALAVLSENLVGLSAPTQRLTLSSRGSDGLFWRSPATHTAHAHMQAEHAYTHGVGEARRCDFQSWRRPQKFSSAF